MEDIAKNISIYSGLLETWRALSLPEKAMRLDSPEPQTPAEAITGIQNVVVDVIDHIDRLSDDDEDSRFVTLVGLSKRIDPRYGFALKKLRHLVCITKRQPYETYQICFLKTYSKILFAILEHFFTKSARNLIHQAGLIFETNILPMCTATPENFSEKTSDLDAVFEILESSFMNCAKAMRRAVRLPTKNTIYDINANIKEMTDSLIMALSKEIKKLKPKSSRKHGHFTQAEVAEMAGVSRITINRWERGPNATDDRTNPTNNYGYYRNLRVDPALEMALKAVIGLIKKRKPFDGKEVAAKICGGNRGRRRRSEVSFRENMPGEKQLSIEQYNDSLDR